MYTAMDQRELLAFLDEQERKPFSRASPIDETVKLFDPLYQRGHPPDNQITPDGIDPVTSYYGAMYTAMDQRELLTFLDEQERKPPTRASLVDEIIELFDPLHQRDRLVRCAAGAA